MKALGTRILIVILALLWPLCLLFVEVLELVFRLFKRQYWKQQYSAFWREFKEGRFR